MNELTERQKHSICQDAIELKKDIEVDFWTLGKMLFEIKEGKLWVAGWDSWEEYCMEFKFANSDATISKLTRLHSVLVLEHKIPPARLAEAGGWSSLAEVLPMIKDDTSTKKVNELLEIAIKQPRKHLRTTIREMKRGEPCKHKKKRLLLLDICEDGCGERWSVTDDYSIIPKS